MTIYIFVSISDGKQKTHYCSTPISNEKSRSAFVQRLLRDTVKEFQDRHRQRERTLKNEKFIDQDFPTNRSSLYLSTEDSDRMYDRLITQWLRIEQISLEANSNKPLVVYENSISVQDFRQGTIGDCWFICALACLTLHHASQLGMIIPNPKLCPQGIYQVFLCLDGKWQPLEIDDYFPCDQYKRLVFSQVGDPTLNHLYFYLHFNIDRLCIITGNQQPNICTNR